MPRASLPDQITLSVKGTAQRSEDLVAAADGQGEVPFAGEETGFDAGQDPREGTTVGDGNGAVRLPVPQLHRDANRRRIDVPGPHHLPEVPHDADRPLSHALRPGGCSATHEWVENGVPFI